MSTYQIKLTLLSDATFSRGDGVAGLLDREVEHDKLGLPFLHGRTLKGLLGEEADNILYALNVQSGDWLKTRHDLFGKGGSTSESGAIIHYSHAQLPPDLRQVVEQTMNSQENQLTRQDILTSLTAVRRQTAVNGDGIPHDGSLRSMRVILRQTVFTAELTCAQAEGLSAKQLALLAAAVLSLHRAGTGRNRGRGQLQADLLDAAGNSLLTSGYQLFSEAWA